MTDLLKLAELQNKISDMSANEALTELERFAAAEKDDSNDGFRLIKAEILFALADEKLASNSYYGDYVAEYYEIAELLEPIVDSCKYEAAYPKYLYMLAVSFYETGKIEKAENFAERFYKTYSDDNSAYFLLTLINFAKQDYARSLTYADRYLENGDFLKAAHIKAEILIRSGRYEEAYAFIKMCKQNYPDNNDVWNENLLDYYIESGEEAEYVKLIDTLISSSENAEQRKSYFYRKLYFLYKDGKKAAKAFAESYSKRFENDHFGYFSLFQLSSKTSDKLRLLEKAYGLSGNGMYSEHLLELYARKGDEKDSDRYFQLLKQVAQQGSAWSAVKETVYSIFCEADKGLCAEIMESELAQNPDDECGYSLLGKIYELGVGVPADTEKAFSLYQTAYGSHKHYCGCSALFLANAYFYGVGTAQNKYKAGELILEIIDERQDDSDRACLYALLAFGGDSRFDKERAINMLGKFKDDACSLFLLYKFSSDETQKNSYLEKFIGQLKKCTSLERKYLKKYADDPSLEFVTFIKN